MKTTELMSRIIPALLSGTSRQPLQLNSTAIASAGTLAALSLAAQSLRFECPIAPDRFALEGSILDERRILPDALRKPMIWLLRNRRLTEDVELALAWNFSRLALRPHPFDLPRLGGFAKAYADELGPTAQAWAQREGSRASAASSHEFFRPEALDATNWSSGYPAQRVNFILQQRSEDAATALALLQSAWSNEDADMRVRLLQSLGIHLTPSDKPFLEELHKDRAPRVRDLAQRLLCRLPGATGTHPALAACLERIERSTSGFLRNRVTLKLQFPATVKEHQTKMWIRETFANVSCDELAKGLSLSEPQMIEAAQKDSNLLLAIALMATQDHQVSLLELVVKHLPDAWEALVQCGPVQLDGTSPKQRALWAEVLLRPYGATPPFSFAGWSWMHRALRGPVPPSLIAAVVRSSQWRETLQETKGPEWMELLAACCPASQRTALRGLLETIEPSQTITALALLDLTNGMERGRRDDGSER